MKSTLRSASLDWLIKSLEEAEPASLDELSERPAHEKRLGFESEAGLRMTTLFRKLSRNGTEIKDPETHRLACEAVEKLRLLDRRMNLGEKAEGVTRFNLYRDGSITARSRK